MFVVITGNGYNACIKTSFLLCLRLEDRFQVYLYFSRGKRLETRV